MSATKPAIKLTILDALDPSAASLLEWARNNGYTSAIVAQAEEPAPDLAGPLAEALRDMLMRTGAFAPEARKALAAYDKRGGK